VRSPIAEVFADLEAALSTLGLDWYLIGAQAAVFHGLARLTADVDVTVMPGNRTGAEIVAAMVALGFHLRVDDPAFVRETRVVPAVHTRTGIAADVVLGGPGLEAHFLDRAESRDVEGVEIRVARVEDLIAMKILSGRVKDIEDVVALLAAGSEIEVEAVRDIISLIEEALGQSDLMPALDHAIERAAGMGRPG